MQVCSGWPEAAAPEVLHWYSLALLAQETTKPDPLGGDPVDLLTLVRVQRVKGGH